jgi:FMN phosphatase YigB (HAD superfamily)
VTTGKPEPAIFEAGLDAIGRPQQVAMVGDRIDTDISGPGNRGAGIWSHRATWPKSWRRRPSSPITSSQPQRPAALPQADQGLAKRS